MRFSVIVVLLLFALFAVAHPASAQNAQLVSEVEVPVLEAIPAEPVPWFLVQQPEPPAPALSHRQLAIAEARAAEDRYRTEIESFKENKHQFVHCKLKNGRVLTGTIHDAGFEAFTLRSDMLGDGTYIYYKDLAELPRAVPAVGTRIKQGAQITGMVIFVVVFFIPLALTGAIPSC